MKLISFLFVFNFIFSSSIVTFDLDGLDDCGFVSVTGTFDNWSGWGANTDNNMSIELDEGSYEYVVLCVNTDGEWWNDIWSSSTQLNAPIGSECDFDPSDEFPNYGMTVGGSDMTISLCPGSCSELCDGVEPPSDTNNVTFYFDGLEDCGQVNITGTFDNWSGWGVNPADHPDYTIALEDGEYEFLFLCVDTSNDGWWNDVWSNSTTVNPPVDGDCSNGDPEFTNYAFTVTGENMSVSYCAGTCDLSCDGNIDPCIDIDCGEQVCVDGVCVDVDFFDVSFSVDMSNVNTSVDGVYIVGNDPLLEGPTGLLLEDADGDDVWEITLQLPPGSYTYKFRNGFCDNWDNCGAFWEDSLDDCGVGDWGDREVVVSNQNLDIGPHCFNSCDVGLCPDDIETYPITFVVDMGYQETDPSGVYVVGGNIYMEGPIGHLMDDSDGDDVWEVTVDLPPGTYTFKYRNGYCGSWDTCLQWQWEDFGGDCGVGEWGDREIVVVDQGFTYGAYCFDFCETGECPEISPVEVTFQVEIGDENLSEALDKGVYMYGNFNGYDYYFNPLELDYPEQGSNIFSINTVFNANDYILYKYTIGMGFADANPETDGGIAGCGSNFAGDCGGDGANFREQTIPYFDTEFDLDTYDDCPGYAIVSIGVDMSQEMVSGNGVCIAGGTMPNGPEGTLMCDLDNDDIYTATLSFPYDSHQTYKFVNGCGDTWENPGFEIIEGECTEGQWDDRFFDVEEDGQIVGPYYFGTCDLSSSFMLGDVNEDGDINVFDVVFTIDIILGNLLPSELQFLAADVNVDNAIDVIDVILIVEMILG